METDLKKAVALLNQGELVGMPTETVYGLAGDALNSRALAKIFEVKQRPLFDPLILHVFSLEQAREITLSWPEKAERLAEKFWPGPLTLILPKKSGIPDLATSGLSTVAIRIPAHPLARQLLKEFGKPIAAPSANRFGRISPTTADAVRKELGNAVPLILDGGPCTVGLESTIVALIDDQPQLLRAGGITTEAIEEVIGKIDFFTTMEKNPLAPGQLKHHYAPQKPLHLVSSIEEIPSAKLKSIGFLAFGQKLPFAWGKICQLSAEENLIEAASHFFAMLRELDESEATELYAIRLPNHGLGIAMNDRLTRASAKRES